MQLSRLAGAPGRRAPSPRLSLKITITRTITLAAIVAAGFPVACNKSDFRGSAEKVAPTLTREFVQDTYPAAHTTRTQGYLGEPRTQAFEQGEWGQLDLLVVVDDSGSMAEEQVNLASKLDPLLKYVARSDWRIAVVTTDPADGCQRALIEKADADAKARFRDAVAAGTGGSGEERGLLQAVAGLKAQCLGAKPWVRPDSTVSVLVVSDEDNCYLDDKSGYGCSGKLDRDADYLADYLATIRSPGEDARVYGLVWHPTTAKAQCTSALKQADTYAPLIEQTKGKWGSICDADYTATLEGISEDIARILKAEVELETAPDAGSLAVTVDGKPWTEFELDGRKVRFTKTPPFGAKVEVGYRVGEGGAVAREFELDKTPVAQSLSVSVDGESLDPAAYRWDEEKQRLVFAEAPAEKAKIEVDYQERVELRSAFDIGPSANARSIRVFVDGAPLEDGVAYDAATGLVTVTPPPPAGSAVKITFKERAGA
jgi:hypothetical protein